MEYVIWAKGPTLGPVRSFIAERRKKRNKRVRRKHPTKLVEAAACCLLSPLTISTGWIFRGVTPCIINRGGGGGGGAESGTSLRRNEGRRETKRWRGEKEEKSGRAWREKGEETARRGRVRHWKRREGGRW